MTRLPLAIAAALIAAVPAHGATTLGETQNLNTACAANNFADVQVSFGAGSPSYTAPSRGVITSWSHDARQIAGAVLKFKVFRPITATSYLAVGESAYQSVETQMLHTFPVTIPVLAGDKIGLVTGSNAGSAPPSCFLAQPPSNVAGEEINESPDFAVGTNGNFNSPANARLSVSAKLEADADCNGLGDESQGFPVGACGAGAIGPTPVPNPIAPPKDTTKPTVTTKSGGAQNILAKGGVTLAVTPNENSTISATGQIPLAGSSAGRKTISIKLKGATRAATAGKALGIKLGLAKKDRSQVRRALRRGKLKAKLSLTATDAAGNAATSSVTVKLKRP